MPSPATRHRIEFGVPEDERRLLLRVWRDDGWSGDLLFGNPDRVSTQNTSPPVGEQVPQSTHVP